MSDWVGKTLSKVSLEGLVGRGGMAEVYVGRHTTLNRRVAVKILHAHMSEDPDLLRRFQTEAQSVAGLRHPNIVQVLDFDVVDGRPYIVMELLAGLSLSEYLKALHDLGHSLSLPTVLRLTSGIASALDYAHSRGIVHRDVKPANVILRQGSAPLRPGAPLGPDVEPVLTDFGIARIADATTQTASGLILGTPAYMSPEQVRGEAVDARSDIYSLGIILYEMLAGINPFSGQGETTPASVLYKQVNEPPPPIPATSPAIREVVSRTLAKDREQRYQSARELAKALEQAIAGRSPEVDSTRAAALTTVRESIPGPRTSSAGYGRLLWGMAGLLVVLGIVGGAILFGNPPSFLMAEPTAQSTASGEVIDVAAFPEATPSIGQAPASPAPAPVAAGVALFQESGLLIRLNTLQSPPSGFEYNAWLSVSSPSQMLHLGVASLDDGVLAIPYPADRDTDPLRTYDTLLVSLEPAGSDPHSPSQVTHTGTVEAETLEAYRRYLQHTGAGMEAPALLQSAAAQAVRVSDHLTFTVDALAASDLAAAKMHSEHIINLVVGGSDPVFQDWDGNGRAEAPGGDDFGMIPYLRLIGRLIMGAAEAQDIGDEAHSLAQELNKDITEGLVPQAERAITAAKDIAGADSLDLVGTLGLDNRLSELQEFDTLAASTLRRIEESGLVGQMALLTHMFSVSGP